MSSSATPDTSSALGQCVVCGKETSIGCSTCKSAGLNWMFFCSVEHQKLIWKTHKLVCGKNPFLWPALSDEGVSESLNFGGSEQQPGTGNLWKDVLYRQFNESADWVRQLTATRGPEQASDVGFKVVLATLRSSSLDNQVSLFVHRSSSFQLHLGLTQGEDGRYQARKLTALVVEQPINYLTHLIRRYESELPKDFTWPSLLKHRLLIFIGILQNELQKVLDNNLKVSQKDFRHLRHSVQAVRSVNFDHNLSEQDLQGVRKNLDDILTTALIFEHFVEKCLVV